MQDIKEFIDIVETNGYEFLWHGTSEPAEKIKKEGLLVGRHGAVFLTDNPDLAIQYAETDQERSGLDNVTLIKVNVKSLDKSRLAPDLDHTTAEDWVESLQETDQCMYMGSITPNMISKVEDFYNQ